LVKGGAARSKVRVLTRQFLSRTTEAYGYRPNDPRALERACTIPSHMVSAESHFRAVYRHKFDRKASEDDRPRIKRTIAGLQPMEIVVMDVHHVNVRIQREDGTAATPKLIAFMDIATRRVWCELVFIEKSGGVRNIDVIEAFVSMARDPSFGLPQFLYCDNGSENNFAGFLDDALKLNCHIQTLTGERKSQIIKALPYNAAAKPVEGWFGQFEQQFLRHCQGWIDDDRMNPARPAMGKLPSPFEGGYGAFNRVFFELLRSYEHFPQSGALCGRSPAQTFQNSVENGWAATVIDPENLLTVFTRAEKRVVRNQAVSIDGRIWTCPELDAYLGNSVIARVPAYHGFNELLILEPGGRRIGIARPQEEFGYHDTRGAKCSAQRVSERNKALYTLGRSVPDIDVGAEIIAFGKAQMQVQPNAPRGKVSVVKDGPAAKVITPDFMPEKPEADQRRHDENIARERREFMKLLPIQIGKQP
jgi:hypothetical protein